MKTQIGKLDSTVAVLKVLSTKLLVIIRFIAVAVFLVTL